MTNTQMPDGDAIWGFMVGPAPAYAQEPKAANVPNPPKVREP